jgi:hypothetical protein
MRMTEAESLSYLTIRGFQISPAKFYRIKRDIEATKFERLSSIAKREFVSQHLERIDQLELVIKEMWHNYHNETNPSKKVIILQTIARVQPYLSQYYEATAEIAKEYCHKPTT